MTNDEIARALRRASRELFKDMPTGGPVGPPKGKRKVYSRKVKHPQKGDDR